MYMSGITREQQEEAREIKAALREELLPRGQDPEAAIRALLRTHPEFSGKPLGEVTYTPRLSWKELHGF